MGKSLVEISSTQISLMIDNLKVVYIYNIYIYRLELVKVN